MRQYRGILHIWLMGCCISTNMHNRMCHEREYLYICIHTNTNASTSNNPSQLWLMGRCKYMYRHICIIECVTNENIYKSIHTHTNASPSSDPSHMTHGPLYIHICTHIHNRMCHEREYLYVYIHTHMREYRGILHIWLTGRCIFTHAHSNTHIHTHIHIHWYVYIYTHI